MRVLEPYKGGLVVVGSCDEPRADPACATGSFIVIKEAPGCTIEHRFQVERLAHPWAVEHPVRMGRDEEPPNVERVIILQPGQSPEPLRGFEAGEPEFVARGSI